MKDTDDFKFAFTKLDSDIARLVIITNASFANARDYKRQLGYLIYLVDNNGCANIVYLVHSL